MEWTLCLVSKSKGNKVKNKKLAKKLVKQVLGVKAKETKKGVKFNFLGLTYKFKSDEELSTALQHLERWLNIDHNLVDINKRLDGAE